MVSDCVSYRRAACASGLLVSVGLLALASSSAALPPLSTSLQPAASSASTGEKPQSKVWTHGGSWWSVFPDSSGTWIRRLDGDTWTNRLKVSDATTGTADARSIGGVVHILLYRGTTSELVSAEYVSGTNTYQPWSSRLSPTAVSLDSGVETATIDIDSQGRMWLASDAVSTISVRYSDPPYNSWSAPIQLASGISSDDICVVTSLPNGTVGVLWSNQNTQRFGFRVHADGDAPSAWAADEVPASQSALNVGLGMADDHLNVAVAADGTLYAAVKTSYDTAGYPKIALLVRRSGGSWDDLYPVDTAGTRAIILLSEPAGTLSVVYTSVEGAGDIVYRESPTSPIGFGARSTLVGGGNHNDVTSTKQNIGDEVVFLTKATSSAVVDGVLRSMPPLVCGDGYVAGSEGCDDANLTPGDGCSSSCDVETCYSCSGQPSSCSPANGVPCDDGLFCNGTDTCSGGACGVHAGSPCVGADGDGDCAESCNESADNCGAADPDGSVCSDGLFCNGADTCSGGACGVHAGSPCVGADGDGNCAESCDEIADNCNATDPDGSVCSDGLFCNGTDACSGGACSVHSGSPCIGADGDGNCAESCNEGADNCTAADPNGSPCSDGLFCTLTDSCLGGVCSGNGDPCAGGTECSDSCDEWVDGCADAAGTPCTDDGNDCTDDECNGNGVCAHAERPGPCDDGLACTTVDACVAGACVGSAPPECDDGNPCTQDLCDDDLGCISAEDPRAICLAAGRSSFQIRDSGDDSRDQLRWKWLKGEATVQEDLGDPSVSTAYTMCVYDAAGGVSRLATVLQVTPTASWVSYDPRGWRLKDTLGTFDGVWQIKLTPGSAGRSKVQWKARGIPLPLPAPASASAFFDQAPRVVVQLLNSEGACWGSEFTTSRRNTLEIFKAKAP